MPRWHHTVKIKDLIGNDDDLSSQAIRTKAQTIVDRFNAVMPAEKRSFNLEDALDEFGYLADASDETDDEALEAFDNILSDLYDACDRDRIWLGP